MFPDLAAPLTDMIERIVDLLPLTRNSYYHPAMKGSWSIKNVLPTIDPELDYSLLDEVQHCSGAQAAYLECIQTSTTAERRNKLQRNLLDYCKLDTLAMVRLARFLERQEQNSTNQMSAEVPCRRLLNFNLLKLRYRANVEFMMTGDKYLASPLILHTIYLVFEAGDK